MSVVGKILFFGNGVDLDSYLRACVQELQVVVDRLPESEFEKSDEDLAQVVMKRAEIIPLEVDFKTGKSEVREAVVDVSHRFDYGRSDGRQMKIQGLRATKTFNFKGDQKLWFLRPNRFNTSPPHGEVRNQAVSIGIEVPTGETERAASYIEQTIKETQEYLSWQEEQVHRHNQGLLTPAIQFIQKRRVRLRDAEELRKKLSA